MIKAYAPCDFQACCDLFIRVFNAPPWNDNWTEESAHTRLREFTENRRFAGFTLWENGALIGAVFCTAKSGYQGDSIFVEDLFVAPDCQGRGYGTALMDAVETYARRHSFLSIVLITGREYPSFGFYQKRGYKDLDCLSFMHKRV